MRAATIRDFTGGNLIRFESVDGCRVNVDDDEARRRIAFGDLKFRGMPGNIVGKEYVEAYLYRVLGLDPHRYEFDLPSTMYGTGSSRAGSGGITSGHREGFVFERGKKDHPIGKVIFLTYDRRFQERDPEDRRDFEALR